MNRAVKQFARNILGPPSYDEVTIAFRFLQKHRSDGWVVDVGAHVGSSSRPFAESGWRVLAVEPDPAKRPHLERLQAAQPSVHADYRAITLTDDQDLTLYQSSVSSGISTLTPFHASHSAGPVVKTVRLDTLLSQRHIDNVAFLKTDVEGYDLFALQSFPWQQIVPLVVVCEFENRKTRSLGYDVIMMADFLSNVGYVVFVSEWYPIVEYGMAHRWKAIRTYPCGEIGERAWGNLIAVRPEGATAMGRLAHVAALQLRLRTVADRLVRLKGGSR